jgi:carbon monoxide dehydrogenase subunit G
LLKLIIAKRLARLVRKFRCVCPAYASPEQIAVEITTPLPGLRGPFPIAIAIAKKQAPSSVELQVQIEGKEGSVNAGCKISVADETEGTFLTYDAKADLAGLIAIADNPVGQPIVKASLNSFFKNLDKTLEASLV